MSNRSWFYASGGQQQGPYPEAQLRDLITRGMVSADTLVWTEGMSGWQRAGDIPGLVPGGSAPPSIPHPGAPPPSLRGYVEEDLPAALQTIRAATRTGMADVDLIGCSLEDRWGRWQFLLFYIVGGCIAPPLSGSTGPTVSGSRVPRGNREPAFASRRSRSPARIG